MNEVKGTALAASLRYATEKMGAAAYRQLVESLAPEEKKVVEAGVLASGWYPMSLLVHVMEAATRLSGDPRTAWNMGRASADYALTTIYKIFFKVGSPQFVISKAGTVFKTYYTTGNMAAVVSEKGHAVMEITGLTDPSAILCERIQGWMERTVELSGGKDTRMVHPMCLARGDASCRYEGWWA